ncbi:hypothetical protein PV326_002297, partial [Microctonus aethiopoides]
MEGEKKRSAKRRSLEAGREMLARYKESLGRNMEVNQTTEPSDDEILQSNEVDEQSVHHQSTSMIEDVSCRDTTQSSISVSEGEGDGDIEGMAGRVAELKELLHGKEAMIESLSAEIEHMRTEACSPNSSQSHNSISQDREILLVYKNKLQDFEQAIFKRDHLIQELTSSLEQALAARDAFKIQISALIARSSQDSNASITEQERINVLEETLSNHVASVTFLNSQLSQSREYIRQLENEKKNQNAEINDYKTQINYLNEQIRACGPKNDSNIANALEIQKQYESRIERIQIEMQGIMEKFAAGENSNTAIHEQEMKELEVKHQNEIAQLKQNYEQQYKILFERYNTELPALECKHAKELHVFQSQLLNSKKTIDAIKSELEYRTKDEQTFETEINKLTEQLFQCQQDKAMLQEQINLHKIQVDELTAKCVAVSSILNSKESIERSLEEALTTVESLKRENDNLKFQYDDLSARYAAAQSTIENNQLTERSLNNRLSDMEKSLSRMSGINSSFISEFNTTTYQTFDDVAIQYQMAKSRLEEKETMEKQLIERVQELEKSVNKANQELDEANTEKNLYEKQLKDIKNKYEKMISGLEKKCETNSSPLQPFQSSLYFPSDTENSMNDSNTLIQSSVCSDVIDKINSYEKEIVELRQLIKKKEEDYAEVKNKLDKAMEKVKQYKCDSDHLKKGLSRAWEQCAKFEERLNETLAMNDSKFSEIAAMSALSNFSTDLVDAADLSECASNNDSNLAIAFKSGEENKSTPEHSVSLESIQRKLDCVCTRTDQIEQENQKLREENLNLLQMQENFEALKQSLDELNAEKALLIKEIANLTEKHNIELSTIKSVNDSTIEMKKIHSLLSNSNGESSLEKMKCELEKHHAKEMEELRTYFEEKCLQMEKQYSEEIFSQQSKKMSDDSEIDELTDDLYYGGGGDCVNVSKERAMDKIIDEQSEKSKVQYDTENSALITAVNQLCQTEWDVNVENGELTELRAAYSNQLEEQVALAKRDILNALQEQIQALITVETDSEENWPPELLELRNKFTNNAKREMEKLRSDHLLQIAQLKDDYSRNLSRTIERYQEEINKLSSEITANNQNISSDGAEIVNDIVKQRDNLYKTCVTLKSLITELVKYFATCEEELNNTLISEVLKRKLATESQVSSDSEKNIEEKDSESKNESTSPISPKMKIKRVHFAPQCSRISTIIKNDTNLLFDLIDEENDIARELRTELDKCLQRMKAESAQVFEINLTPGETMLDTLSKQIAWTTKINEELSVKLSEAESTIDDYEAELQQLKSKFINLQEKLIAFDTKKEIVSEGYGEQDNTGNESIIQDLTQLHEKARLAIMSGTADNSYLLQLIEELCTNHDKVCEETNKEKEDLQQQIEAADKQLRSTRKFLEEQASEREIERDDAARQIHALEEQIKEREREKVRDYRKTSEVEALESQLREMSSIISETESKRLATEMELKTAVDKIWELREIIVDLELQIQGKLEKETEMTNQIDEMKGIVDAQTRVQQELLQELEANKISVGESQLNDHIIHLQEELRKHKLSTDHFNVNSTALKQMKSELHDMLSSLDKRIKELEALHMCGSNLSISQPSEDVSIRDQIDATRCLTPDDPNAPPTLPLDLLLKLKDKMLKHARAEDVAFKRIKDLDMQLTTLKIQNEELQAEQEMLQHTASEQLFQIEAMRGRLEQQKQNAPFAQRQATSRLESQLHDVNTQLHHMEQTLGMKELELKEVRAQLLRANQLLNEKQDEIVNVVESENNLIQELKDRIQVLEEDNKIMVSKLEIQEHEQQKLPNLIHSMLTDKNDEIDHLKDQLSRKEKQLQTLTASINNGENNIGKQNDPKNSARTLSDILSIHSECEEAAEAIREVSHDIPNITHNISSIKRGDMPPHSKDQFDESPMRFIDSQKCELQIPTLDLGSQTHSFASPQHLSQPQFSLQSDYDLKAPSVDCSTASDLTGFSCAKSRNSPRSQALINNNKLSPSKVQLLNSNSPKPAIEDLETQLKAIHKELQSKSATLSKRELELDSLQKSLDKLRAEFKDSIDTLTRDNLFYKNQYELCQESESKIRRDLEEVENYLKVKTEELDICKEKVQVNERILIEIQSENGTLKKSIDKMCEENSSYQITIQEKAMELKNLKEIIFEKDITIETVKMRNEEIENENKQLYEFKTKFESCKKDLTECQNEIKRLTDGINSRDELIQKLEEVGRRSNTSGENSPCDKDQEIYHLREQLKIKEKIIKQMSDDSKSLHRNLEKIQNKMKESGNVLELRTKLKEEKMFNAELTKMVAKLKQELELLKDDSLRQSTEDADIEDMVQRELNLSADLDKKIMSAIESESDEMSAARKIEKHSCNSLTIKPVEQDLEMIMQQYTNIRQKLKQAIKLNEELNQQKDELEIDRELLKSQVMEYENRILQIKTYMDNDNQRAVQLMNDLADKNGKIRNLEIQLQKEKTISRNAQLQDSELIGNLRVKLAASLEAEQNLRDSLATVRQQHKILETKLNTLKEQIQSDKSGVVTNFSPPLKEIEQNDAMLAEKYEKVSREIVELNNTLKTLQTEKSRHEAEINAQIEERGKLLSKLALTEGTKECLEVDLKRTKEELKSRIEECDWLQKQIKIISDAEEKKRKQRSDDQSIIKNLRIEIKNLKAVMKDLEVDSVDMKRELMQSQTEQTQLSQMLLSLRKSETDLQKKLNAAKSEADKLRNIIADLECDLQIRTQMDSQSSKKDITSSDKIVSSKLMEQNAKLTSENIRYSNEKSILLDKLTRTREDLDRYMRRINELETKSLQFYGRYLRVESKRKSLSFQKRYLLCIIGGYQLTEGNMGAIVAQLTNNERSYINEQSFGVNRKNPKARFRTIALVIISVSRMKWMMQRWRGGLRGTAANFVMDNAGQFYPSLNRNPVNHSPPVRERHPFLNSNRLNLDYDDYTRRLVNIQQSLGLAMSKNEPDQTSSPYAANLLHENVTYEDLFASQTSSRWKRAPFHAVNPPDLLRTIIKDGEEEIYIEWHRAERYLVNENLPVYTAHLNSWGPNHKKSEVMKKIGKLVFYQSTTHFSTLVLLRDIDRIIGIIDNRYMINGITIDQLSQPLEVGGPYVIKLKFDPHYQSEQRFASSKRCPRSHSVKREIYSKQLNENNIRIRRDIKTQNFYVEILAFVTYDVCIFHKNRFPNTYLLDLITYYIIHLNFVDMVFSILPTKDSKVFINLAGFIIEAEDGVFSQITNYPALEYNNNKVLDTTNIFEHFKQYPNHFDFPFTKDSFDYIFLLTGRNVNQRGGYFHGVYSGEENIFEQRRQNFGRSFVPMAVYQLLNPYRGYCKTAQYIASALGIERFDPVHKKITNNGDQCYGIMQRSGNHCPRCMKWSKESISQMKKFASKNPNRCFLLNKPRSLYPPGTPIISSSPCGQCQCFGFGCYQKENPNYCSLYVPVNHCAEPLKCSEDEYSSKLVSTISPLDGTPCGENKVCWDEKCSVNAANLLHENVTSEDFLASQTSARLKRVPFHTYNPPESLRTVIKDGEEEIHVEWYRAEHYLVNENLPVYTAHLDSWGPNHKKSDVMKKIGKLVIYHSTRPFSTLTFIQNLGVVDGVIDNRYVINNVKIDELTQPLETGGPYVKKLEYDGPYQSEKPSTLPKRLARSHSVKREIDSRQLNGSNIRIRRDIKTQNFYVEILVFITYDVYMHYTKFSPHAVLLDLITHYVIHFNSVDMVFSILPTNDFKIFINLAGFIIEAEDGVFSRITKNPALEYNNNPLLDTTNIFEHFKQYPNHFDFPFTKDSFDYIFLLTGRKINSNGGFSHGEYRGEQNIFEQRRQNFGRSFVPMSVSRLVNPYESYCKTAQYIGIALGIEQFDPVHEEKTKNGDQCYGIMRRSGSHCPQCMKWSKESMSQLEKFTTKNPNRCFLLNKPRSLHPP